MKNKLVTPIVAIALSIITFNASANLKNTLSLGYAQTQIKIDGDKVDGAPKGINIKYDRKLNESFGIIGSIIYNHKKYYCYDVQDEMNAQSNFNYYLLTAGPSYRFNEYINIYGLIGTSIISAKYKDDIENYHEKKASLSYGVGLQINPISNIAIDASYEYSKVNDANLGTWVLGVGYRF